MAEALALVGGVSSILQIISSVTKLAKSLNEVRESYNNVALNITLVASKLSTIRLALEALHKWRASDTVETEASIQLDEDLGLSLSCCAILITVIEGKLAESGYTPGLTLRHKMKYVWLEDILKEYVSNLEGQVQALQLLLTIFQCRTATEQRQELAKTESRNIIELVRAETMTLGAAESELDDAMSILSHDHSVHLDVESIIMKSPAYRRVYGEVGALMGAMRNILSLTKLSYSVNPRGGKRLPDLHHHHHLAENHYQSCRLPQSNRMPNLFLLHPEQLPHNRSRLLCQSLNSLLLQKSPLNHLLYRLDRRPEATGVRINYRQTVRLRQSVKEGSMSGIF